MFNRFWRMVADHTEQAAPLAADNHPMLEGWDSAAILRLRVQQTRFLTGDLNEWPEDYQRLRFIRWLYAQGKIRG